MYWIYDEETFPNIFTAGFTSVDTGVRLVFEHSWRRNQIPELIKHLAWMKSKGVKLVGFNNDGFDYPVLHQIIQTQHHVTPLDIYNKAMQIIDTPWENRFSNVIWDRDHYIPQVDLFKIHHFDNAARATSLKALEFNMRRQRVRDLPFPPGTILDWDEMDTLIEYMWEDIDATLEFFGHTEKQIAFREDLTEKYGRNFMNHSDPKIGADYIIMMLEQRLPGFDKKRQTKREKIVVNDIIFPYVKFDHPELNRILEWFRDQELREIKGSIIDVNCSIGEFQFDFGLGGIHGSVKPQIVEEDEEYMILDIDVTSYYPNLAIRNNLYPEHLGQIFCGIYEEVYEQRKQHKKGTTENAMLKLALNATFGKSNDKYSCFFDTQLTMGITINGQLLLCMLAEQLMKHPDITMLQVNTDGLTIRMPYGVLHWVREIMRWWESVTKLELEESQYSKMAIRDVNNYIAVYTDGKVKRKGCYASVPGNNKGLGELDWSQNHSALVIPMAAEAYLLHGTPIKTFIESHQNIFDFMLRAKVNRTSRLVGVDYRKVDHELPRITRYFISVMGLDLIKIMPPLKHKVADRRIGISTGWKTTICNDMDELDDNQIEFAYYIKEAQKLVKPLMRSK